MNAVCLVRISDQVRISDLMSTTWYTNYYAIKTTLDKQKIVKNKHGLLVQRPWRKTNISNA